MKATQSQGPEADAVGGERRVRPLREAEQRSGGERRREGGRGTRGERHAQVAVEPPLGHPGQLENGRPADDRKPGLPREPGGSARL